MLRLLRTLILSAALFATARRRRAPAGSHPTPRAPERFLAPTAPVMRRRRAAAFLAVAPVLVIACGCASGGGGGSGTPTTVTTPVSPPVSPPPPPPPSPPAPIPSTSSAEYNRNYGLAAIRADAAYAAGATGAGITVAVIDTGVNAAQPDLVGAVSPNSVDIISARNQPNGADPHGTYVAGVIASQFNGFGTIGVAYKATILGVRADINDASCTSDCTLNDSDIARGIDYAVGAGARIINLSLGGDGPSGTAFQAALQRAVAAGVVVAISAGNDGAANPHYPALYATDPRYTGSVIAVGSVNQSRVIVDSSNRAGTAAAGYVTAPGDRVVSSCDGTSCYILSGTSFSAPHVAGALALLLQAFPNLSGRQAVSLLLTTSDDLGAPGIDTTYGYGEIDLARAFAPVGTVTTQSITGGTVLATSAAGVRMGAAFGDAVRRTEGLRTVGYDAYDRRYSINLAGRYHATGSASLQDWLTPPANTTDTDLSTETTSLHLSASRGADRTEPEQRFGLGFQRETPSDVTLSAQSGRFSFTGWRGQGGVGAAPGLLGGVDAFASIARPTAAARSGVNFGFGEFSYEAGSGERRQLLGVPSQDPSRYQAVSFSRARGETFSRFSFGSLTEPAGPLGSLLPAGTVGLALPARTNFASTHFDWHATRFLLLSADGSIATTRAAGLVGLDGPVWSSTWKLGARTLCEGPGCIAYAASLEQPVRIEAGGFSATLADVPDDYFAPLTFSTRHFSATPSGRELDLRLSTSMDTARAGLFSLQAVAMHDEGQIARAPLNLGLIGAWRARW